MNWAAIGWLATSLTWLVLMILFLVAEASTVSLVSIWFAFGCLAALVVSLFHGAVWLQMTAFLAVSALMLILLRPLARKYFVPKLSPTNVDTVVGTEGFVTGHIDNLSASGQVKLGAMYWTARSTSGAEIPEDTLVRVDRVEGVKVFVSPVPEERNPEEEA